MQTSERNSLRARVVYVFTLSVMVLLVFTGLAKLVSALGNAPLLDKPDPVVPFLTKRQLLAVAGLVELVVAWFLRRGHWQTFPKTLSILWLAAVFVTYRIGLSMAEYPGHCSCLGNATQWLHTSPDTADGAMKALLCYMAAGALLLTDWPSLIRKYRVRAHHGTTQVS